MSLDPLGLSGDLIIAEHPQGAQARHWLDYTANAGELVTWVVDLHLGAHVGELAALEDHAAEVHLASGEWPFWLCDEVEGCLCVWCQGRTILCSADDPSGGLANNPPFRVEEEDFSAGGFDPLFESVLHRDFDNGLLACLLRLAHLHNEIGLCDKSGKDEKGQQSSDDHISAGD
jgi:hypothetical protein